MGLGERRHLAVSSPPPRSRITATSIPHATPPHHAPTCISNISRELGENLADDELQAMIDEFDRDQDGEINQAEFMYIMKQSSVY